MPYEPHSWHALRANTDIMGCPSTAVPEYQAGCANYNALDFTLFSRQARALGAQSLVTVNYGSGTPAEAAAEVKQAGAPGQQVALWEIGNEGYGCWEANNYLVAAPERYQGFRPTAGATCPMATRGVPAGTQIMARSYGANAPKFMAAMRAANPSAVLGVPWAFDLSVGGGSVAGNTEWNSTVLAEDKKYIGFVDAHWYPLNSRPVEESPYLGYLLAGALAQPGAKLMTLAVSPSAVLAFQSVLRDGKSAVLLINTSTSAPARATYASSLSGELTAVRYRAGNQNKFATKTTTWSSPAATVAKGMNLPAESITLLREN
jgi:hypothetical protein